MARQLQLQDYRLRDIFIETRTMNRTVTFLQNNFLISTNKNCTNCGQPCYWDDAPTRRDRFLWRCGPCKTSVSVRHASFFSQSRLPMDKLIQFIYLWSMDSLTLREIAHELQIGSLKTLVDWSNFMRDVCAEYFNRHMVPIGGPGTVVEIDESKFGKRKYNRGRQVDGRWVLGGVERGSQNCFLVPVRRRDAATILPIIMANVQPGTRIITDEWRAYRRLRHHGFAHDRVNHAVNFVDPNDNTCHTNTIESLWKDVKRKHKRMVGSRKEGPLLDSYLKEFMWRKKRAGDSAFNAIVEDIVEQYVV